jgi:hypothetical protein
VIDGLNRPQASSRKRRLLFPIALIVIGSLCAISGFLTFLIGAFSGVSGSGAVKAPISVSLNAHAGDYYVYQQVGAEGGVGFGLSTSAGGSTTLRSDQVVVTAPTGTKLVTWSGDGAETITVDSAIYGNAVGFHVKTAGTYQVRIDAVSPSSMIVGPSIGGALENSAPWLLLCLLGLVGVVTGGVLLIVGQRRGQRMEATTARSSWSSAPAFGQVPVGSPAPGWYQDPSGSSAWRWWDGRAWTSHLASRDGSR